MVPCINKSLTIKILALTVSDEITKKRLLLNLFFVYATTFFFKCFASVADVNSPNWSELDNVFIKSLNISSEINHFFGYLLSSGQFQKD